MIDTFTKALNWDAVLGWFHVLNDLSLVYVIGPFILRRTDSLCFSQAPELRRHRRLGGERHHLCLFRRHRVRNRHSLRQASWISEYDANLRLTHLSLNWVTIVTCVLLADLAYDWDHRLMHRIGVGWATHTVHHSSPHFNMSVAYRFALLDAGAFRSFSPSRSSCWDITRFWCC